MRSGSRRESSRFSRKHTGSFAKAVAWSRLGMRSMPPLGLAPFDMASWPPLQNTAKKFHPIIGEHFRFDWGRRVTDSVGFAMSLDIQARKKIYSRVRELVLRK